MIPRAVANRFPNVMGVDLHIAQQEVVLLYALDALAKQGTIEHLVFKGGTYVRMMVTSCGVNSRKQSVLTFARPDPERAPTPSVAPKGGR
jgi:hypothetical protein